MAKVVVDVCLLIYVMLGISKIDDADQTSMQPLILHRCYGLLLSCTPLYHVNEKLSYFAKLSKFTTEYFTGGI